MVVRSCIPPIRTGQEISTPLPSYAAGYAYMEDIPYRSYTIRRISRWTAAPHLSLVVEHHI